MCVCVWARVYLYSRYLHRLDQGALKCSSSICTAPKIYFLENFKNKSFRMPLSLVAGLDFEACLDCGAGFVSIPNESSASLKFHARIIL